MKIDYALNKLIVLSLVFATRSIGQNIITDGTVGEALTLNGPNYSIPSSLGTQSGGNLFHSFSLFNIPVNQTATFSGPSAIPNIISRVTGGSPSMIDGTLRSEITNANLFLLNKAGIMFGADSQIDVDGQFVASTADYVGLGDTDRFYSFENVNDSLISVTPTAFGFLSNDPSSFTINGVTIQGDGKFSLIGGDIDMVDSQISAPGGNVNLVSVKSPGIVNIDTLDNNLGITLSDFSKLGDISIAGEVFTLPPNTGNTPNGMNSPDGDMGLGNGGMGSENNGMPRAPQEVIESSPGINVNGDPAGDISIFSNSLNLMGQILLQANGKTGGNISITSDSIIIDALNSDAIPGITSNTRSNSEATDISGKIILNTKFLKIVNGTNISAITNGSASGGDIIINSKNIEISTSASIVVNTSSTGPGGNIFINSQAIAITGDDSPFTGISAETLGAVNGANAGKVEVVAEQLDIRKSGRISSQTRGSGNGGDINLTVTSIMLDGQDQVEETGIRAGSEETASGKGGNISIMTKNLEIKNGGEVSASTEGAGDTGRILIEAENIQIQSQEEVKTGILAEVEPGAMGTGDSITIKTGTLGISGNGSFVSATTFSSGKGGDIDITAEDIMLDGMSNLPISSGIVAESLQNNNGGNGGEIRINTNSLNLMNGAQVITQSNGSGNAGKIELNTTSLNLTNAAAINSSSRIVGISGEAGLMNINAKDSIQLSNFSSITTSSQNAAGGDITINATNLLYLANSNITTSANGGDGNGGNINIDPINVILNNSRIVADAFGGNGGNITIIAKNFIKSVTSIVSASSGLGIDGNIDISSPDIDVSAGLVPLNSNFINAADWVAESCSARTDEETSSFLVVGKEGSPPRVGDLLNFHKLVSWKTGELNSSGSLESINFDEYNPKAPCLDCE